VQGLQRITDRRTGVWIPVPALSVFSPILVAVAFFGGYPARHHVDHISVDFPVQFCSSFLKISCSFRFHDISPFIFG
jgi:hypothetical protein